VITDGLLFSESLEPHVQKQEGAAPSEKNAASDGARQPLA
jgi:hypothetical protein